MIDDFAVAPTSVPADTGIWYDDDTLIPYLTTYSAKHSRPLDRAALAAWLSRPVVAA